MDRYLTGYLKALEDVGEILLNRCRSRCRDVGEEDIPLAKLYQDIRSLKDAVQK